MVSPFLFDGANAPPAETAQVHRVKLNHTPLVSKLTYPVREPIIHTRHDPNLLPKGGTNGQVRK
jgi:hypothetical protein